MVISKIIMAAVIAVPLFACARDATWHDIDNLGAACPAPVEYSRDELRLAANELRACGDKCKQVRQMLKDYGLERQKIRAAREE